MMSKYVVVLLLALFVQAIPAFAQLVQTMDIQIDEVDNLAVWSNFTAGNHQLKWSKGGVARLYDEGGGITPLRVNVDAVFDNMTDHSSGGLASASFASGNFTVTFYADVNKTINIGHTTGEIYPGYLYNEYETQQTPKSALYGSALMRLTFWDLSYQGTTYDWSEGLYAKGGLTATTTNMTPATIDDYQHDWSSKNTLVKLLADQTGIPEPASIILLGLGGLALIRKRKT